MPLSKLKCVWLFGGGVFWVISKVDSQHRPFETGGLPIESKRTQLINLIGHYSPIWGRPVMDGRERDALS